MKKYFVTNCNCNEPMNYEQAVELCDDINRQARRGLRDFADVVDEHGCVIMYNNKALTVRVLVEDLGVDYAQVVNCEDSTFRGVVMNQDKLVKKYKYEECDNSVYIWI